jgi:hypothetical protein
MRNTCKSWALAGSLVLALAGCGGGGGDSAGGGGGGPVAPAGVTVSGVAATGAAFTDAVITIIDSRGVTVGTSQPVGTDGTYNITLDAAAVAPFVLVATRTDANGESQSLVSVIASASTTTANITPITTLIASRLSPSGDPTKLADELAAGDAVISAQAVADTVVEVQAILAPLLTATSTTGVDPLTGTFSTNGTGYDRLLDSVNITFLPASPTTTNIEIVVKQELAEGEQPTSLSFSNETTVVNPLPTIDPATLVAQGTSARIAAFLGELSACYALPVDQRVTGAVDPDEPNNRTGDAAAVTAPACLAVFSNNSAATFLSGGARVGRTDDNRGAFASLFRGGATGVVFSQGSYEFTRTNGDIVAGYKSRDTGGNETYDTFVLKDDGNGKLRLIGNQYRFGGGVKAYQQRRNFITLGQEAFNYYSTGYVTDVPNTQRNGGGNLFDRVVVTTPTGSTLTLKPSGAASFLGLVKPTLPTETITATSFVRLRAEYVDGDTGRAHPRTVDPSLFFVSADRSEAELAATASQGTWKMEYYTTVDIPGLDGLPNGVDERVTPVVQYFKNRARALTIAELRTQGLAQMTPGLIADIQSAARTALEPAPGQVVFDAVDGGTADISSGAGGDGWSVSAGQLPPTSITLFGRSPTNINFTDSVDVRSTLRQVSVPCSVQGIGDDHCFNGGPRFAVNSRLSGVHLFARNAAGREYANFYALYQLNVAP